MSGKKNSFTAILYPEGKEKDILYTIEGQWTDSFTIKPGSGHSAKKADPIDTYNARTTPTSPLIIAPLSQQDPYESNRAWEKVAQAIVKSDMDTVHVEKSKIENAQRELRRKEAAEGREWQRRFFIRSSGPDAVFEKLVRAIPGERIEAEKTGGVWRFDEGKKEVGALLKVPSQGAGEAEGTQQQGQGQQQQQQPMAAASRP